MNSPEDDLPICPNWRRFIVRGDRALVLCGAESLDAPPLPETDLGPRATSCPWWTTADAFKGPSIRRLHKVGEIWKDRSAVKGTFHRGKKGIEELEGQWDQAVEDFRREVTNSTSL